MNSLSSVRPRDKQLALASHWWTTNAIVENKEGVASPRSPGKRKSESAQTVELNQLQAHIPPIFLRIHYSLNVKGNHEYLCFSTWFPAADTVWGGWGAFKRWGVIGESRSLEDSGMSGFMVSPSWLCPDDPSSRLLI